MQSLRNFRPPAVSNEGMRHNRLLQTRLGPVMTAANLVSLGRIVLVPLALRASLSGQPVLALILGAGICASDVLDGAVARATNTASRLGAILDVVADVVFVFTFQCVLMRAAEWPPYLLAASACAISTFLASWTARRAVARAPFGRYLGAALMALLMVRAVLAVVEPALWSTAVHILGIPVALYALGATVENLVRIGARGHAEGVTDALET